MVFRWGRRAASRGRRAESTSLASGDAALLQGLRSGDPSAASALLDCYGAHLERVLARIVGTDPELADLLHDVMAEAIAGARRVRDPSALRDWLTSVAIFRARTYLRRRARHRLWVRLFAPDELPEPPAPHRDPDVSEALRCTYEVLEKLPANERIALALRLFDGMELADVARACSVSLATVKRRLARAEARFRSLAEAHPVLSGWVAEGTRWGPRRDKPGGEP